MNPRLANLRLQRGEKWFAHVDPDAEDEWCGPCNTFEAAIMECMELVEYDGHWACWVAKGHKTTKAEREEWGMDIEWEVNTQSAIQVVLDRLR